MEENLKNLYYLKNNEKQSPYISYIINSLLKSKKNQILILSPIFIREDHSSLVIFFKEINSNYLYISLISLINTNENNYKEIKIEFKKEHNFSFGEIKISHDKKNLIILNENKTKAYIILNFIEEIILNNNNSIKLQENNYFEIKEGNILDIKFNNSENDDDIIIYAIYSSNNILSIFNNKYLGKEFQIFLNESIIDFQIIKKGNEYDLYLFDKSGNFKLIKNIHDIKNIPKSDKSDLVQNIDKYEKILYNMNSVYTINEYKKCFLQFYNTENKMNILYVIRAANNAINFGILVNNKLHIIKNYDLTEEENIDKIIPINSELNKCLIKSDKNIYLLDIASLSLLFLPSSLNDNKKNNQDFLLIINEIINKIKFSLLLKLPSKLDNKCFAINYNFYNNNLLIIKTKYPEIIIKIYDFEIDIINNNNKNINIENDKNKINDDTKILMKDLLLSIKQQKEMFLSNQIIQKNKEEYYNKILEEIFSNINKDIINNNSININEAIGLMKEWYTNAYTNIKLYGELIKNKNKLINNNVEKSKKFSEQMKKSDEIILNIKKRIENKFKLIEKNEKEITQLKKDNSDLIQEFYLMNNNDTQNCKNLSNEIIKRMNNYILRKIKFVENNLLNNNDSLNDINFQQMKNFPLTMKYLDVSQKEKLFSFIDSINNLINTLKKFHDRFKEK